MAKYDSAPIVKLAAGLLASASMTVALYTTVGAVLGGAVGGAVGGANGLVGAAVGLGLGGILGYGAGDSAALGRRVQAQLLLAVDHLVTTQDKTLELLTEAFDRDSLCVYCGEPVSDSARLCPHCHTVFTGGQPESLA